MKEFIKKIKSVVVGLFSKLTKTAKAIIPVGIAVVNAMKKITDSPNTDVITALTPSKLDEKLVSVLRAIIPKVLSELEGWDLTLNNGDENEVLLKIISRINSYPKKKRNALHLIIAATINKELSNGNLSQSESILATQTVYDNPEIIQS